MIKDLRIKRHKTRKQIARLIGVSLPAYKKIETDIENASPKVLLKLCQVFGVNMRTLFEEEEEAPAIEFGSPYEDLLRKTKTLTTYLANIPSINNNSLKTLVNDVIKEISSIAKKPNLGVFGRSDAGKSHLINYLIGESKLPAQLQPTTSAITILRHLEDRPDWLDDEVIIFLDSVDILRLDDKEYCLDKTRLYKQGNIRLLSTDCIHDHDLGKTTKAFSSVVYLDADILRACNIIDVPGFANTDADKGKHSDAEKAQTMLSSLDVLIYMSPVNGCIDHTDMSLLQSIFSQLRAPEAIDSSLPVFSNLFFVASQAASHHNDMKLETLKNTVSSRIYRHFTQENCKGLLDLRGEKIGQKITVEALRKRWFSFWTEIPERREPLIRALSEYLKTTLPELIRCQTQQKVKLMQKKSETQIKSIIQTYQVEVTNYVKLFKEYKLILSPKPQQKRFQAIKNTKLSLQNLVEDTRQKTIYKIKAKINAILTEEELERIIRNSYNKRYAPSLILERLQSAVENIFKRAIYDVEKNVSEELEKYSVTINKIGITLGDDDPMTRIAIGYSTIQLSSLLGYRKLLAKYIIGMFINEKIVEKILENIESEFKKLNHMIDKGCDNLEDNYRLYLQDIQNNMVQQKQNKKQIRSDLKKLKVIQNCFSKAPWRVI